MAINHIGVSSLCPCLGCGFVATGGWKTVKQIPAGGVFNTCNPNFLELEIKNDGCTSSS